MVSYFLPIILFVTSYSVASQKYNRILQDIDEILTDRNDFKILLTEIMSKYLVPYKCVAIVMDYVYGNLFEKDWFEKFQGYISFVLVNVKDSEDLFAPYNTTEDTLNLANRDGCQMNIILISNGLQVARLLIYGDRYRVLDTRSKYIILFDNRLFDSSLFYIWRKIINVVFINKKENKKSEARRLKGSWYELTTVPFPLPLKSVWIPKRLDVWINLKFRKGTDLFHDKTNDLKSQTLKAVAFSHIPGTVKEKFAPEKSIKGLSVNSHTNFTENIFTGTEIEILKTISKAMKFRCELYEPKNADVELWGRKQTGGGYSGLIGEMTSTNADIALGDLYYIPFILNFMDLSIPYNTECLTFLTPESLTDNSWNTLILPFPGIMWASVILCLIISAVTFHLLARFHEHITELQKEDRKNFKNKTNEAFNRRQQQLTIALQSECKKLNSNMKYMLMMEKYQPSRDENEPIGLYQFSEPVNSILYTYSMLLLVSLPKLPTGWSLRMLTGWYWLYCLLLVVAYKASMTAILSRPTPRITLDTLPELVDSKLNYGSWGEINKIFFKSSPDPLVRQIGEGFETVSNSEDAVDRVAAATFAFYENTYFLKEALVKRQLRFQESQIGNISTNQTQTRMDVVKEDRSLHIMKSCIINMPISIGLQKNSPIKPRVDKYIRRVLEAGLITKWLDDVMQKTYNTEIQANIQDTKALMSIRKFSGAIVALFVGYILGITILIIEIIYFKYVTMKNPHYNKYLRAIEQITKTS